MKVPTIETIKKLKESGRMRKRDEIFWEGDHKMYYFWLHTVEQRIEKWQKNKK